MEALTERPHKLEGFRNISEGELSEVAHDWCLRELQMLLLSLDSARTVR